MTSPAYLLRIPGSVFRRDVYPHLPEDVRRLADSLGEGDTLTVEPEHLTISIKAKE